MKLMTRWALVGMVFVLMGCEGTAEALGLGRNPPDEFAVVDRPPLSMPPDYDLRPPRPGAPRPQEVKMTEQASQTVFGRPSSKAFISEAAAQSDLSDSEKALLAVTNASGADPNIRNVIDREAAQKVNGSDHLVEEILWWRDPSASSATVDAKAEKERLEKAKEEGKSVTSGATPVIEKGKSGWLGL